MGCKSTDSRHRPTRVTTRQREPRSRYVPGRSGGASDPVPRVPRPDPVCDPAGPLAAMMVMRTQPLAARTVGQYLLDIAVTPRPAASESVRSPDPSPPNWSP
jgi:hypothetical protein